MRKLLISATFVFLAVAAIGATQEQGLVMPVLEKLEFQIVPSTNAGGPIAFKVTKKTIEHLSKIMDNGSTVVLENDGSIKVVPKSKK